MSLISLSSDDAKAGWAGSSDGAPGKQTSSTQDHNDNGDDDHDGHDDDKDGHDHDEDGDDDDGNHDHVLVFIQMQRWPTWRSLSTWWSSPITVSQSNQNKSKQNNFHDISSGMTHGHHTSHSTFDPESEEVIHES